jgi:gas vesicle protein
MTDQKSDNKFGLGLIFGALVGAVTAFFLTPTTGEENRKKAVEVYEKIKKMVEEGEIDEKAKELFGEVNEEGKRLISEVRSEIMTRLDSAKHEMDTFDKTKFTKFVDETIAMVGQRLKASSVQMEKLREIFVAKFECEEKKTEKAKKVLKPKISV